MVDDLRGDEGDELESVSAAGCSGLYLGSTESKVRLKVAQ